MSYPPPPGFYSGSNRTQASYTYGSTHATGGNQNNYQSNQLRDRNETRSAQYSSHNSEWHGQAQTPSLRPSMTGYGQDHNVWRGGQAGQFDYQRHTGYHPAEQPATATPTYHSTTNQANIQDIRRLNNLAYVSTLDPSRTRTPGSNRSNESPTMPSQQVSQVSMTQNRAAVNSPIESPRAPIQSPVAQPMQERSSSNSSVQMAMDAAAALAGAVTSRYGNLQHLSSATAGQQVRVPPATQNSRPQQNLRQHTKSPFTSKPAVAVNTVNRESPSHIVNASHRVQQHSQMPTTERVVQIHQQRQQTPSQPTASVASVVRLDNDVEQPEYSATAAADQAPYCIDPTQVFNPYHREHERKKREMAEAEARQRAEEANRNRNEHTSEGLTQLQVRSTAGKSQDVSATANSGSKATEKTPALIQETPQTAVPSLPPSTANKGDGMAAEMKALMDRMKAIQSKDPSLFQKMWSEISDKDATNPIISKTQGTTMPENARASMPAAITQKVSEPTRTAPQIPQTKSDLGPNLINASANGYRVVVEDNPEGLPDLGRFPAERRIRQSYKDKGPGFSTPKVLPVAGPSKTLKRGEQVAPEAPAQTALSTGTPSLQDTNVASPEPRRRAVAIAAIHLLKAMPENSNHPITAQELVSLLEQNPSYLDLCSSLESRGLKFQRIKFARDLLSQVPDLNTGVSGPSAKQSTATLGRTDPASRKVSTQPITAKPAEREQPTNKPLDDKNVQVASVITSEAQSAASVPTARSKTVNSRKPEPMPGTKEAAARKRDFAELIDMTQLDDDEDYVVLPKKQRIITEAYNTPSLTSQSLSLPTHAESSVFTGVNINHPIRLQFDVNVQSPDVDDQLSVPSGMTPAHISPPQIAPAPVANKPKMILAQKLKQEEALQKSLYDPKTVARDILIASGRHPSERPLNIHLAGMLQAYIDLDSDISTFDWDAIDPGGPLPPKVDFADVLVTMPRQGLGRRKRRAFHNLHQTNFEKRRPPRLDVRNDVKSSTTESTPQDNALKLRHDHHRNVTSSLNLVDRSTLKNRTISVDIPNPPSNQSARASLHQRNEAPGHLNTHAAVTPGKRRGRPPGSKNKSMSIANMKAQSAAAGDAAQNVIDLPAPVTANYKCKWVKCGTTLHNLETLRRHVQKRHAPTEQDAKHGYQCWWKNCKHLAKQADGSIAPSHIFDNEQEWIDHIAQDHIHPVGLKYGSGPSTTYNDLRKVDFDREYFLCDEAGRLVTPVIGLNGEPGLPSDTLQLTRAYLDGPKTDQGKSEIIAQKAFMKAHGNKLQDTRRHAEETVRAMAAHKQKIGPGIDRGGCTLVNETRRTTFLHAPGITRIIEADY